MLQRERMSRPALLRRLLRSATAYDVLMLNGSVGASEYYVDLIAAWIAGRRRRPTAVVLYDCSWKIGSVLDRIGGRAAVRALDSPAITYCVLSSEERDSFPRTWGVDRDRVVFTPYGHTLNEEDLAAPVSTTGGVFAGGNSLRDYGPLIEAVRGLDAPVTIASSIVPPEALRTAPDNVEARPVPHERFVELLRSAAVVVTPIVPGSVRSAGMQTWLNAMALGKLVVVTRSFGTGDYIEDRRTGLVVAPGDVAALREALLFALDPANREEVDAIRARAAEVARTRFSPDAYAETLLRVAEGAVERVRGSSGYT
jgi:hypothetical protein